MNMEGIEPAQTLRIYNKVGPMIEAAENTIELEDSDYEIVKRAVESSKAVLFFKAQLLMTLEENQVDKLQNKRTMIEGAEDQIIDSAIE